MYKNQYKQTALPLIQLDSKTGKFHINQNTLNFIQTIPSPLAVISVAGMYRTGKSYLLNRMLLNRSDGFGIGPTVNPCTKGLWIWGKPIIAQTKNNQSINVLVIDSQGLGALDEDSTHDSKIFALTILLSSVFMFNSQGSIDQNALQGLNLVLNLTKFIKISEDDNTGKQFKDFFPDFYWIVRDFSLQLVNSQGKTITSKQYLEKALQNQKSTNQNKNKIRQSIISYFPNRNCFTLVRPLTKEQNLQMLDRLPFEDLRPQFVEQVLNMRKKIFSCVKIKEFKGKKVSGQILVQMILDYTNNINKGGIPVIENTWSYICKTQCQKYLLQADLYFQTNMRDNLLNKLPLKQEQFKNCCNDVKNNVLNFFRKKVNDNEYYQMFVNQLKNKISSRFLVAKAQNQRQIIKAADNFLKTQFQSIDRKIKHNQYKNISDFVNDCILFIEYFNKKFSYKCNNASKIYILQFINKKQQQGLTKIQSRFGEEKQALKQECNQIKNKFKKQSQSIKQQLTKQNTQLKNKNTTLENQIHNNEIEKKKLKNQMNQLSNDYEIIKNQIQHNYKSKINNLQQSITKLKHKLQISEIKITDIEKQKNQLEGQIKKKEALYQQKQIHFNQIVRQLQKKQKQNVRQIQIIKNDCTNNLQEQQEKYYKQTTELRNRISNANQQLLQFQRTIERLESQLSVSKQNYQQSRQQWKNQLKQRQKTIQKLNGIIKEVDNVIVEKLKMQINELKFQNQQNQYKFQRQMRQKEELYRNIKRQYQKQKALNNQKIEFYQQSIKQKNEQLDQQKQRQNKLLEMFDQQQKKMNSESKMFNQFKIRIENQKIQLEKHYNYEIQMQSIKINNQQEQINKLIQQNLRLSQVQQINQKLTLQLIQIQQFRQNVIKQYQLTHTNDIKQLFNQLQQQKKNRQLQLQRLMAKSQEAQSQLKNFYQMQKEQLQKKILEQRANKQEALQQLQQVMNAQREQILKHCQQQLKKTAQQFHIQREQSKNLVNQYANELTKINKQLLIKGQKAEQTQNKMQKQINQLQDNITQIQMIIKSQRQNHVKLREENLVNLGNRQQQILSLNNKIQKLQNIVDKKQACIKSLYQQKQQLQQQLQIKLGDCQKRTALIQQKSIHERMGYQQQLALAKQTAQFMQKKLHQSQKQKQLLHIRYEQKLKSMRSQISAENKDKIQKATAQLGLMQQKYETTRKTVKQMESKYLKQITLLQRQKTSYYQKNNYLQSRICDLEEKISGDNKTNNKQLNHLKQEFQKQKRNFNEENQKLKIQYRVLQSQKQQIQDKHQKEKLLWQQKFKFLQNQKQQAKHDLSQNMKKFQLTISQLKKCRSKQEQKAFQDLIQSMQNKYKSQLENLRNNYSKKIQQLEGKNIKLLQSRTSQNTLNSQTLLILQVTNLKQQRDSIILHHQQQISQLHQSYRRKLNQQQSKLKQIQQKIRIMSFDKQRLQARFKSQNQRIHRQLQEMKQRGKSRFKIQDITNKHKYGEIIRKGK